MKTVSMRTSWYFWWPPKGRGAHPVGPFFFQPHTWAARRGLFSLWSWRWMRWNTQNENKSWEISNAQLQELWKSAEFTDLQDVCVFQSVLLGVVCTSKSGSTFFFLCFLNLWTCKCGWMFSPALCKKGNTVTPAFKKITLFTANLKADHVQDEDFLSTSAQK